MKYVNISLMPYFKTVFCFSAILMFSFDRLTLLKSFYDGQEIIASLCFPVFITECCTRLEANKLMIIVTAFISVAMLGCFFLLNLSTMLCSHRSFFLIIMLIIQHEG